MNKDQNEGKICALITLLMMLSIAFNQAKAQNYFPLQVDSLQFFYGSNYTTQSINPLNGSSYKSLRIDSTENIGTDEIYYNFTTTRDTSEINFECIDLYGGSWLGNKIFKRVDQTLVFLNNENDSIFLKWNAVLGDNWIFYKYDDGTRIMATVNSYQTANIYSNVDSTKKITLQYYNQNNQAAIHPINGKEILLSKTYGGIALPDFYFFPDDNMMLARRFGMKQIALMDVHNFDVGDVFCYSLQITEVMTGSSLPPDMFVYHIQSKFYTQNNTLVNYGRWIEFYDIVVNFGFGLDTVYTTYFDTISVNVNELYPLPESTVFPSFGIDYINLDSVSYPLLNGLTIFTHSGLIYDNSNCIVINSFEPSPHQDLYGTGLGLLHSNHLVFGGGNPKIYKKNLVGYIKNGVQTGSITSLKYLSPRPNKVIEIISSTNNQIILNYFGEIDCELNLYNTQGQKLMIGQKIAHGYNYIDVPILSKGIYILEIVNKQFTFNFKLSIQN